MPSAAALSALSLKRDRSASTTNTQPLRPTAAATGSGTGEPQTKLSKLNAIFTKIARPFSQLASPPPSSPSSSSSQTHTQFSSSRRIYHHHPHRRNPQTQQGNRWRWSHHFERRPSFFSFRSQVTDDDNDGLHDTEFEHNHYKKHLHLNNNHFDNALTAPASPPPPILCTTHDEETAPWTQLRQRAPYQGILIKNESHKSPSSASNLSVHTPRRHLRHSSHVSSSNITVNSEDLTAKEFADIAGIRILPENNDTEDEWMHTVSTRSTHHPHTLSHLSHDQPSHAHHPLPDLRPSASIISYSSLHSQDAYSTYSSTCRKQGPQIWDQEFWCRPESSVRPGTDPVLRHEPATRRPLQSKSNDRLRQDNSSVHMQQQQQQQQQQDVNSCCRPRSCIIKRGRFEIHLEKGTSDQQDVPTDAPADLESSIPTIVTTDTDASSPSISDHAPL